uniref:Uncharacterized protein n=1 Tax=Rhizophora mucronata TaxID=61149 RepID=A0A2P2QV48_RHIMU
MHQEPSPVPGHSNPPESS